MGLKLAAVGEPLLDLPLLARDPRVPRVVPTELGHIPSSLWKLEAHAIAPVHDDLKETTKEHETPHHPKRGPSHSGEK